MTDQKWMRADATLLVTRSDGRIEAIPVRVEFEGPSDSIKSAPDLLVAALRAETRPIGSVFPPGFHEEQIAQIEKVLLGLGGVVPPIPDLTPPWGHAAR